MVGLAGATTLLGVVHEMTPGYDTTIGFDAITVALLGRSNPIGVGLAALLLGGDAGRVVGDADLARRARRTRGRAAGDHPAVPGRQHAQTLESGAAGDGATAAKVDSGTPSSSPRRWEGE